MAVSRYGEVIQSLEFARDLQKQFNSINADVSVRPCFKIYDSNFDKHHYKDFHVRLTALGLALWQSITFDIFSSNSTKFSVVIENAVGYRVLCKSLTRQSHDTQ